jgi:hypothetical protein
MALGFKMERVRMRKGEVGKGERVPQITCKQKNVDGKI